MEPLQYKLISDIFLTLITEMVEIAVALAGLAQWIEHQPLN